MVQWYGVRVFTDHLGDQSPGSELSDYLQVEWEAGRRDPYRSMESRYFIDANVLLSVGEPDREYLQKTSIDFLDHHRVSLVVSPLVDEEVRYQLDHYPEKYRGKRRVMGYLLACEIVEDESLDDQIEAVQLAYAAQSWHGEPGDTYDRIHAAMASVLSIPHLVTWDRRFLAQQALIDRVNADHGLSGLRLMRPDD